MESFALFQKRLLKYNAGLRVCDTTGTSLATGARDHFHMPRCAQELTGREVEAFLRCVWLLEFWLVHEYGKRCKTLVKFTETLEVAVKYLKGGALSVSARHSPVFVAPTPELGTASVGFPWAVHDAADQHWKEMLVGGRGPLPALRTPLGVVSSHRGASGRPAPGGVWLRCAAQSCGGLEASCRAPERRIEKRGPALRVGPVGLVVGPGARRIKEPG
ncbi:hypothetical protein NDU88_002343 [Pleurodeles waltl]|uniref:Uncharacterized protein n=1 Tax=Pleurodeles waltl TaxID=8319 RepID=A0AAV7TKH5_PLEWA|nr:hypothetical protein NDU88_002343 [Pleurodeles waltl]